MLPGGSGKRAVPPALGNEGCIDALPDGVLGHILGFLPAQEAVRTCVLARRWHHLWRTATSLRVGRCSEDDGTQVKELREFVDHLLLRGSSPLDICEFGVSELDNDDESRVNLWFRHVVMCRARVLRLHVFCHMFLRLDNLPLVSQHLTKLTLRSVLVKNSFLNFSSCPALEHLELVDCDLCYADKIASKSLKHLSLTDCAFEEFLDEFIRIRISTPSLVSLRLDSFESTPIFYSMPSLVKAFVRLTEGCWDFCGKPNDFDCTCLLCDGSDSQGSSVLLKGLSQAQSLVLISAPNQGPKYKVEMKGRCNLMERSAKISENLNIVEVKCQVVDERVLEVLKFLCTFNISKLTCNFPCDST